MIALSGYRARMTSSWASKTTTGRSATHLSYMLI